MIDKVKNKIKALFGSATASEDPKMVLRWIKSLHAIYIKEYKKKERNKDLLADVYFLCEELSKTICSWTEDEVEFYGPSILDSLFKLEELYEMNSNIDDDTLDSSRTTFLEVTEKQRQQFLILSELQAL